MSCRVLVGVAVFGALLALVAGYSSGISAPSLGAVFSDGPSGPEGGESQKGGFVQGLSPSATPGVVANRSLLAQLQYRARELTGQMTVVRSFAHDRTAFTQGLAMYDGRLFESTGITGQSTVRELDIETGAILSKTAMPANVFGEGMTVMEGGVAKVLTWRARVAYTYNVSGAVPVAQRAQSFSSHTSEGWGLAYNGEGLLLTDGGDTLQRLDPDTLSRRGSVRVRENGRAVVKLNEAEWVLGEVLANVWFEDYVVRIDPGSGAVLGRISMRAVGVPPLDRGGNNVLNGIACDPATFADQDGVRCFVTGKQWAQMHEVRLHTAPRGSSGAA